ncbi:MAG TPA: metallophosphoesterase [Jatrophihabitantaceae bacterium]|nr:metallophosphoesterase [Jatrophihabitantaceae bacterium]
MGRVARSSGWLVGAGAAAFAYGSLIERNAYTLRRWDVPVLAPGSDPIRVLHVSDLHITSAQKRKHRWIRELAALQPDLVVNTGDTISAVDARPSVMHALEPLLEFPGAFVPGNNDYWAPKWKNPARYFTQETRIMRGTPLPWGELAAELAAAGWTDLTHVRTALDIKGGRSVALAGTDDPHLRRARYHRIAGAADRSADVRIGLIHSPEPELLGSFAVDGYDLVVAGHTHGGQVRLPFGPAIVTNCGIDVRRARWLHPWDERMYFHVCAGLGTNPFAPIRFACRPEASLLTLVPRPS